MAVGFLIPTNVLAEDSCYDVLAQQLGNKTELQTSDNAADVRHQFACSQSYSGNTHDISGGVGWLGGRANASKGDSSQASSSDCGDASAAQHQSAFLYYSQTIYSDAIDAWKACMLERQQFACWGVSNGKNGVTIHARWGLLGNQPTIRAATLRVGGQVTSSGLSKGDTLDADDNIVDVSRNPDQDVTFSMQASVGGASKTCEVWIPPYHIPKALTPRQIRRQRQIELCGEDFSKCVPIGKW
jgi:hypothetical protein